MGSSEARTRERVLFVTIDSFQEDLNSLARKYLCKMFTTSSAPHSMSFEGYSRLSRDVWVKARPQSVASFSNICPLPSVQTSTLFWVCLFFVGSFIKLLELLPFSIDTLFSPASLGDYLLSSIMCLKVSGGCQLSSSFYILWRTNHCSVYLLSMLYVQVMVFYMSRIVWINSHFLTS